MQAHATHRAQAQVSEEVVELTAVEKGAINGRVHELIHHPSTHLQKG